ncbi:MAG: hypothetical protein ACLFU8_06760 [Anaerolineales bacterium]
MNRHLPSTSPLVPGVVKPATRGEQVAHWISQLGSPPALSLLAVALTSLLLDLAAFWALVYLVFAVCLPIGYVIWLVRRGRVTDLDLQLREQRTRPFVVTLAGQALALGLLVLGKGPYPLALVAGTALIQTLCIFLITLRWKISVHTSTAASITVLVWSVAGGVAAAPLVVSVPLIAWSRVKLRRHTPAQTIAGVVLGSTVFLMALWLLG